MTDGKSAVDQHPLAPKGLGALSRKRSSLHLEDHLETADVGVLPRDNPETVKVLCSAIGERAMCIFP